MELLSRWLGRWPVVLACMTLLAAATLLPGLGTFGLWEPQERQLADKVAPRPELAKKQAVAIPKPPQQAPKDGCYRVQPDDAVARTLTNRAMQFGRDYIDDSDAGRRLPLALLGLLAVLATVGLAIRLGGARAGIITGLVVLSMPLLVLQSRQLMSEIGTATAGALILYGLVAFTTLTRGALMALDMIVALIAIALGVVIGFVGGGALLGWLVPIGAFAVAGAFGIPLLIDGLRATRNAGVWIAQRAAPRAAIGRERWAYTSSSNPTALIATLVAIAIGVVIAYQLYSLQEPQPGMIPPQRALLGKAIVSTGCWSDAIGALWRPEDDLRYSFDSTFEQIAYGTYPWGILAIVAMMGLIGSADAKRRLAGSLTLAWAGAAWIACEVFQRKAGFTLWPGFPALAIAIGVWLDGVLAGRARGRPNAMPPGAMLVGLCVFFAVIVLGKDMQSFAERISSLLVGGDQIPYPATSKLALKTKAFILSIGVWIGWGFGFAMWCWRPTPPPPTGTPLVSALTRVAAALTFPFSLLWLIFIVRGNRASKLRLLSEIGVMLMVLGTLLLMAFWPFVWQPKLAEHLSSKAMFDTYLSLAKPSDQLVIMGDLGDAPHAYAPNAKPETLTSRDQIVKAISRPNRVFAIAPQTELCQLHREIGGKPYFVIDDRNTRSLLLSNRVDGTTDKNPLRTAILHDEPKQIQFRPKKPVVFDGRIELLGWSMPKAVDRGDKLTVTLYYKIRQPVGGNWKVLLHIDGPIRINGDHEPIKGRCQTSTWQPGDYIVDRFTVQAGGSAHAKGPYEVWTGFFTGQNPNWKNMTISEAPPEMRDSTDRVKIGTITLD